MAIFEILLIVIAIVVGVCYGFIGDDLFTRRFPRYKGGHEKMIFVMVWPFMLWREKQWK